MKLRERKEHGVLCSSLLPLKVMSFPCCAKSGILVTSSSFYISLQLAGKEASGRASGERPICTLMNDTPHCIM